MARDEKEQYYQIFEEDKKRYVRQKREMEKNGYFTMDDGSKSSDHTPKKKKTMTNDYWKDPRK